MKKVCFVILCRQYAKNESDVSIGFPYEINQRLHQWQDYYSLTSGYNHEKKLGEWEQCIIYSDNNRVISTGYDQVRTGKRNDILLSSDRIAAEDTMFGIMVEALELARSYECCEEKMILHILCDSEEILNTVLEVGMLEQLFKYGWGKKRYEHVYVDIMIEESDQNRTELELRNKFKQKLENFQEEYQGFHFHYDFR